MCKERTRTGVNGEKGPGDGDGPSDITFGRRIGVGSGRGLEEEESKEDEDLGEDASLVMRSVDAESFKSGEENQDSCPSVIEGERKMDEDYMWAGSDVARSKKEDPSYSRSSPSFSPL